MNKINPQLLIKDLRKLKRTFDILKGQYQEIKHNQTHNLLIENRKT